MHGLRRLGIRREETPIRPYRECADSMSRFPLFAVILFVYHAALQSRAAKRTTLIWTDFSSTGFSRMDVLLSTTLTPLINSSSACSGAANRYLLPPFGWDTEPVMGAEVVIEESFIAVFRDLVYGGGWIDIERDQVDRECNWALVSSTLTD